MSAVELKDRLKEIKELQRMEEETKALRELLQDDVKAIMAAQGTDELIVGEYKVKYIPVESNRFDSKAFKEKYIELYNQFMRVTASKRFSIQ